MTPPDDTNGQDNANQIRRRRSGDGDKWHLDEMKNRFESSAETTGAKQAA